MSSACVCHIEGEWCFYHEMYRPLEEKHERMLTELLLIEEYLRDQVRYELDEHDYQTAQAYEIAANKIRGVIVPYAPDYTGYSAERKPYVRE